jgi:hypothetical protein
MRRTSQILAALVALLLPTASVAAYPGSAGASPSAHAITQAAPHCWSADITPHPSKEECSRAKKILTSWERLANKMGIKISKKRREELRRKTNDGTIRISDLPGTLRRSFPSELDRYDLNQIINICNGLPPGNGRGVSV